MIETIGGTYEILEEKEQEQEHKGVKEESKGRC